MLSALLTHTILHADGPQERPFPTAPSCSPAIKPFLPGLGKINGVYWDGFPACQT